MWQQAMTLPTLPYFTSGVGRLFTCTDLKLHQFGLMDIPEYNHKVTGNGYKAVDSCEADSHR